MSYRIFSLELGVGDGRFSPERFRSGITPLNLPPCTLFLELLLTFSLLNPGTAIGNIKRTCLYCTYEFLGLKCTMYYTTYFIIKGEGTLNNCSPLGVTLRNDSIIKLPPDPLDINSRE